MFKFFLGYNKINIKVEDDFIAFLLTHIHSLASFSNYFLFLLMIITINMFSDTLLTIIMRKTYLTVKIFFTQIFISNMILFFIEFGTYLIFRFICVLYINEFIKLDVYYIMLLVHLSVLFFAIIGKPIKMLLYLQRKFGGELELPESHKKIIKFVKFIFRFVLFWKTNKSYSDIKDFIKDNEKDIKGGK